jgi:bile acid:Na+ symporter, BASS family
MLGPPEINDAIAPFAVATAQLVRVAILFSVLLIVFSFALRCTGRAATSLFRNPSLLLRSLLAMNVLLPLFAALMVAQFALRPAVGIALVALAVSPVPPFLPRKQLTLVANDDYVFGLLSASSLLAIVVAPLTDALVGVLSKQQISIAPLAIAKIVALTVLFPFSLGMIARTVTPAFAERASPIADRIGILLLTAGMVPVIVKVWPAMMSLIGNGTGLAIAAFTGLGLAIGHLLGGPDSDHRTVLALATATRHPGVALTIATGNFPDEKLVAPALMLYLLIGAIISAPYVLWRRRRLKRLTAAV